PAGAAQCRVGVPRALVAGDRRRLRERHEPRPADLRPGTQRQRAGGRPVPAPDDGAGAVRGRAARDRRHAARARRARRPRRARAGGPATARAAAVRGGGAVSAAALARPEVLALEAYRPARQQPGALRLNANEAPWAFDGAPHLNRYPPVRPRGLHTRLAALYGVAESSVLATRGTSEAIDLLVRAFCRPGVGS